MRTTWYRLNYDAMIQLSCCPTLPTTSSSFVNTGKMTINISTSSRGHTQVMQMIRTAIKQECKVDSRVKCTLIFFLLCFLDLLQRQWSPHHHGHLFLLSYLCVHLFSLLLPEDFFSLNLNTVEVLKLWETCDNLMDSLLFEKTQVQRDKSWETLQRGDYIS